LVKERLIARSGTESAPSTVLNISALLSCGGREAANNKKKAIFAPLLSRFGLKTRIIRKADK
jgi:hypothetical protein